jgi:hypothetical protein
MQCTNQGTRALGEGLHRCCYESDNQKRRLSAFLIGARLFVVVPSFELHARWQLLALSGQSRHRNILSAIGLTADKGAFWG